MSSTTERVKEWLDKMGYYKEMPDVFENLCNPSTSFIWEQMISEIRPKQEIGEIRMNLIIKRLQLKSLRNQNEYNHVNKDIDTYKRHQQIKDRISILNKNIEEKGGVIKESLQSEKEKYLSISSLKAEINEYEEKSHLLARKSKMSKIDLNHVNEMIYMARNLTPVELDSTTNQEAIKETLRKCAQKLETLVGNSLKSRKNTKIKDSYSNQSVFGVDNTDTPSASIFSTAKKKIAENNRRESLGILPESLMDFEFDDILNSTTTPVCKKELFASSPTTNFILEHSEDNALLPECLQLHQPRSQSRDDSTDLIVLSDDRKSGEVLKSFLHENNRGTILKSYENIHRDSINDLKAILLEVAPNKSVDKEVGTDGLTHLQFLHVQNELRVLKFKKLCSQLQKSVDKLRGNVENHISSRTLQSDNSDLVCGLQLKLESVKLETAEGFLKKELNGFRTEDQPQIGLLNTKLQKSKDKNALVIDNIEYLITNTSRIFEIIKKGRNLTLDSLARLNNSDLDWVDSLKSWSCSKEIEDFEGIRLDFVKNQKQGFTDFVPFWLDLDPPTLKSYLGLIKTPFSNHEDVFMDLLELQKKLDRLKLESPLDFDVYHENYCLDSLRSQEKFVPNILNELNHLIQYSVKKVLPLPSSVEKSVKLIEEENFKKYISGFKDYDKKFNHLYNKL